MIKLNVLITCTLLASCVNCELKTPIDNILKDEKTIDFSKLKDENTIDFSKYDVKAKEKYFTPDLPKSINTYDPENFHIVLIHV